MSEASALTLLLTILDDERFIAACREYDTGSAWRSIDEAPTDETPVLITGFRRGKPWLERFVHEASYQGGRWRDATGFSLYPPTHFMPLPDPPVDVRPETCREYACAGDERVGEE
ncbi:hypothetical protein JCM15519_07500 [Fundidesulfovibrio butyratiphilus]